MAKRNEIIIDSVGTAEITLSTPRRQEVDLEVSGENIEHDEYPGPYTVTPKREVQTLHTKSKTMALNVTVFEIPYVEVRNPVGGKTVTIGGT